MEAPRCFAAVTKARCVLRVGERPGPVVVVPGPSGPERKPAAAASE
ncbi:hypothetical protein SLI_5865 [Streptomyces lividans 1326]|uniref:Uncharacterized protein n=1 Tax=Streptomyces lividans 1326 TaxID=1200984 RepID=A0A7U9E0L4_STRLI|nr:hypothetical protein SLI_5865 [Streptomyces lividans 1326]